MRVLVAGANGAVGRRLVPMLVARGHEVIGTTTNQRSLEAIQALGAEAVLMDGLDAASVGEAVARTKPDAIIHEMTALSGTPDFRHFDLSRFLAAAGQGDVDPLIEVLAEDVIVYGDGGGKVPQWGVPIVGAEKVARMFAGLGQQLAGLHLTMEPHHVNGQPGAVFRGPPGGVMSVMSFEIVDGRIARIRSVVNPDKLGHLGPVESLRDVLDKARAGG